ncbi:MAG: sporulation protein YabP [Oscillospiraceae bacterium]|nr:sporulation protein YabP [Oscillospiraceae bacterium]
MNQNNYTKASQNIILENRKKIMISGVKDIDNFDDNTVSMITTLGSLIIKGSDLKINKFSVETGDVSIEGTVNNILYDNFSKNKNKNFWAKIIK